MSQFTQPQEFTDPKSAKAQAKAEKAYKKASRPFYKKKRFILLAIIALIVIIVVATSGGDSSSNGACVRRRLVRRRLVCRRTGGWSQHCRARREVRVHRHRRRLLVQHPGNDPITTTANGVFCVVSVNVSDIGDKAQTLDATSQYGYDAANNKYSTDTEAEFYLPNSGSTLFEQLNPGTSVAGQLVFDVPAGTQLTKLELHDSMFSGGADVTLG